MALCINDSGTYRNITTLCVNQSGTYRDIGNGSINQAGTYRTFLLKLGASFGGGFLICKASPLRWVVSPRSAEVSRNWYGIGDAVTCAQQVSGCTGWFVPTQLQIQNPGYLCRSFWGPSLGCNSPAGYWSSTIVPSYGSTNCSCMFYFNTNQGVHRTNNTTFCVRAFRCVTY